jgi:hypothetical protein
MLPRWVCVILISEFVFHLKCVYINAFFALSSIFLSGSAELTQCFVRFLMMTKFGNDCVTSAGRVTSFRKRQFHVRLRRADKQNFATGAQITLFPYGCYESCRESLTITGCFNHIRVHVVAFLISDHRFWTVGEIFSEIFPIDEVSLRLYSVFFMLDGLYI